MLLQLCFSLNRAAAARVPALLPGRGVTDTPHSASVRRGRGEAATRLLSAAAGTITAVRGLRDTAEIPCTAPPTTCMSPVIATIPMNPSCIKDCRHYMFIQTKTKGSTFNLVMSHVQQETTSVTGNCSMWVERELVCFMKTFTHHTTPQFWQLSNSLQMYN